MLTRKEREMLCSSSLPENGLGWYCDGQVIMPGNNFEVVEEEKGRKGDPDYFFCSVGMQGRAVKRLGSPVVDWTIIVEFPTDNGPKTIGCTDIHLRKL